MKVLIIATCSDPFSHSPMKVQTLRNSNDYSQRDMEGTIQEFQAALKSGQFSKLQIHLIETNEETGEVTIHINRTGENPLKTKTVINPEAQKVREARLARAKERIVRPKAPPIAPANPAAGIWPAQAAMTGQTTQVFFDDLGALN
jgi:hypothetical protein